MRHQRFTWSLVAAVAACGAGLADGGSLPLHESFTATAEVRVDARGRLVVLFDRDGAGAEGRVDAGLVAQGSAAIPAAPPRRLAAAQVELERDAAGAVVRLRVRDGRGYDLEVVPGPVTGAGDCRPGRDGGRARCLAVALFDGAAFSPRSGRTASLAWLTLGTPPEPGFDEAAPERVEILRPE